MGIDFNAGNLIKKLAQASAGLSKGDNLQSDKIDTKDELFTFMTGLQGIKNQAKTENVDMTEAEIEAAAKAELNEVLDFNFGTKEVGIEDKNENGFFDEDEISLENLMSYLDDNIEAVDKAKIEKYNELGVAADKEELDAINTLEKAGFDQDLINVLMKDDSIAGAMRYIVKDILSGRAEQMSKDIAEAEEYSKDNPENYDTLDMVQEYYATV